MVKVVDTKVDVVMDTMEAEVEEQGEELVILESYLAEEEAVAQQEDKAAEEVIMVSIKILLMNAMYLKIHPCPILGNQKKCIISTVCKKLFKLFTSSSSLL